MEMSTEVIHEGWMIRYYEWTSIFRYSVQMRYFVLTPTLLAYYESDPRDKDVPMKKALVLDFDCSMEDRGLKRHHGNMVYVLSVYNERKKNEGLMMASFNIQEALVWKKKIEKVIDQLHQHWLREIGFYNNDNTETTIEDHGTSSDAKDNMETRVERNETNINVSKSSKIKQGGSGIAHEGHLHNTEETREETYGATSQHKSPDPSKGTSSLKVFSYLDIECATNGLSESSKIGQGGYGSVYRGCLNDTEVAIKMLDANGKQGTDEFIQELEVLGQIKHPNLVNLIGACFKLRALVYEFLPNGSIEDCLKRSPRLLTWQLRTRIVHEICSALVFLHSNKPLPLVHGDLKPHNILLDVHFKSKLADFGLCRFLPEGTPSAAFLDTKPKGTLEYIDPAFLSTGILTPLCDVYSFGVTILRLLTGMEPLGITTKMLAAYKGKSVMMMVDPAAGNWRTDVAEYLAYFGLKCCSKKKGSGLLKEILEDIEIILAEIDN